MLAEVHRADAALRRHDPYRCRRHFAVRGARRSSPRSQTKNLAISGLGYYPNPLHPDRGAREAVIEHLKKVIVAAGRMGVPVVNTFCGGDAAKHVDANWQEALKVWPDIVALRARQGGQARPSRTAR